MDPQTLSEEKKRLRREKLAAWKKKQEQKPKAPIVALKPATRAPTLKKVNPSSIFNEVEEEEAKPQLSLLTFSEELERTEGVSRPLPALATEDSLDAYMKTLGEGDLSKPAGVEAVVEEEEEEEESGDAGLVARLPNAAELLAKLNRRKELPLVNHAQVTYEPFRRDFYTQVALGSAQDADEAAARLLLEGIKTKGGQCPRPILHWSELGLPLQTAKIIEQAGYARPTPIQSQALPAIMAGRDVIGVAPTGSGKTLAFLLPLFRHVADQRPLARDEGPVALVVTPTRELATQIFRESRSFMRALNLRGSCAYGGSSMQDQIAECRRGVEFVVGTPGRLVDLLAANHGRVTNLRRVTFVVLDEADRMFDMGFEPQLSRLLQGVRPDRQTVMFSATFPPRMETMARRTLCRPVEIVVGARSVVGADIAQEVEVAPSPAEKFPRLLARLGRFFHSDPRGKAVVFVDRQDAADALGRALLKKGHAAAVVHGGREQSERDAAVNAFRHHVGILVATSVAARGLDIKRLNLVVNYDAPSHMEDYVHRVGRTGRAGTRGAALTLLTPDQERHAADIARVMRISKADVPPFVQEMADRFLARFKAGQDRYGAGFGGRGLERLESSRDRGEGSIPSEGVPFHAQLEVGYDETATGFSARVDINDLPPKARWVVAQSYKKVTEEAGVSVTTRGRFYPENLTPRLGEEPKLYVLVEGPEPGVRLAVELFQKAMVEGILQGEDKPGKYTV